MPRKPVHLNANTKRPQGRQVIWEAIRRLRRFRVADLEEATRNNEGTIKTYVRALTNAGYLRRIDEQYPARETRYQPAYYELVHDVGVEAPRVRKDGTEVTQGRGREQLWRTMRIVGEFDYRTLAVQASTEAHPITEGEAKHYTEYLARAGYLVRTAEATHQGPARYRLLPSKYTGPRPPMIQRVRQVWDPNLQKVVWQSQGGEQ